MRFYGESESVLGGLDDPRGFRKRKSFVTRNHQAITRGVAAFFLLLLIWGHVHRRRLVAELDQHRSDLSDALDRHGDLQRAVTERDGHVTIKSKEADHLRRTIERLQLEISGQSRRIADLSERATKAEHELEGLRPRLAEVSLARETARKDLESCRQKAAEHAAASGVSSSRISAAEARLRAAEDSAAAAREDARLLRASLDIITQRRPLEGGTAGGSATGLGLDGADAAVKLGHAGGASSGSGAGLGTGGAAAGGAADLDAVPGAGVASVLGADGSFHASTGRGDPLPSVPGDGAVGKDAQATPEGGRQQARVDPRLMPLGGGDGAAATEGAGLGGGDADRIVPLRAEGQGDGSGEAELVPPALTTSGSPYVLGRGRPQPPRTPPTHEGAETVGSKFRAASHRLSMLEQALGRENA